MTHCQFSTLYSIAVSSNNNVTNGVTTLGTTTFSKPTFSITTFSITLTIIHNRTVQYFPWLPTRTVHWNYLFFVFELNVRTNSWWRNFSWKFSTLYWMAVSRNSNVINGVTTFSKPTFSITTFSLMTLSITLTIIHNRTVQYFPWLPTRRPRQLSNTACLGRLRKKYAQWNREISEKEEYTWYCSIVLATLWVAKASTAPFCRVL